MEYPFKKERTFREMFETPEVTAAVAPVKEEKDLRYVPGKSESILSRFIPGMELKAPEKIEEVAGAITAPSPNQPTVTIPVSDIGVSTAKLNAAGIVTLPVPDAANPDASPDLKFVVVAVDDQEKAKAVLDVQDPNWTDSTTSAK